MSGKKQSSSNSSSGYKDKTDYAYMKDFGGYNNFMASYGLKPYDDDDVQEGKAILQAFREQDKYAHEQEQAEKNNGE